MTLLAAACFYCGCTEEDACVLEVRVDDAEYSGFEECCSWYRRPDHRGFAVCSAPACVKAYIADAGAP